MRRRAETNSRRHRQPHPQSDGNCAVLKSVRHTRRCEDVSTTREVRRGRRSRAYQGNLLYCGNTKQATEKGQQKERRAHDGNDDGLRYQTCHGNEPPTGLSRRCYVGLLTGVNIRMYWSRGLMKFLFMIETVKRNGRSDGYFTDPTKSEIYCDGL